MTDLLRPLHFLLAWFATLHNRRTMLEVDYLRTENRLLRRELGSTRLRLTDADRRELATRALALGRKRLASLVSIVSPDTLLRWHRRLIAAKWTQPLFAIDQKTRAVEILGSTANPCGKFMAQIARNITGVVDGWLRDKTLLLADNDTKFTAQFRRILADAGLTSVKLPIAAPNSNAIAERFVRSSKRECLHRLILFGEDSLRRSLREYVAHYNGERNHQGVGNELIAPKVGDVGGRGAVTARRRLGGLLNFYRRKAG